MNTHPLLARARDAYELLIRYASLLQSPFLLCVRLYWGWHFFTGGMKKLHDIPQYTEYFTGWGVPFPHLSVILASITEGVCGLLLLAGLASRVVSIPLIFTMIVVYLTAAKGVLPLLFEDPDKFVSADPFEFMFAAIIVLVFGPGIFSIDHLLRNKFGPPASDTTASPA